VLPVPVHVHVTVVPAATWIVDGWKKSFSTATSDVVGMAVPVTENVTGEPESPALDAVAVLLPASGPRVSTACAMPLALVVELSGVMLPSPAVTAHVTAVPATGLPKLSRTTTWNGSGSSEPTDAVWLFPEDAAIWLAAAAVTVAEKLTGEPVAAATVAVAVAPPVACGSVQDVDAMPSPSVVLLAGLTPAPVPAAAHATVVPASAAPPCVTRTRIGDVSAVPAMPVCASPLAAGAFAIVIGSGPGGGLVPVSEPPQPHTNSNTTSPVQLRIGLMTITSAGARHQLSG
jgi:hypothetical protein